MSYKVYAGVQTDVDTWKTKVCIHDISDITDTKKLIDRLIDADDVLFGYIQEKISELHAKKNEYEKQLLLIERKVKKIDTKPLLEPLNRWDELTMEEKNALAKVMIERIDITDEEGIKIHFIF